MFLNHCDVALEVWQSVVHFLYFDGLEVNAYKDILCHEWFGLVRKDGEADSVYIVVNFLDLWKDICFPPIDGY